MKTKIFKTMALVMIILSMALCLVGCVNDTPSSIETDYRPEAKPKFYNEDTRVMQASDTVTNEDGTISIQKAEYICSVKNGNLTFAQYYIGEINNCFIQTLSQPTYHDGGVELTKYVKGRMTGKSICEGIGNSISTTDTVSMSNSLKNSISWKFGVSSSTETSANVELNTGLIKSSAGISETIGLTSEIGGSTELQSASEISKSVVQNTYKNCDIGEVEENNEEFTYAIKMSNYEQGYYYALSLVADLKVYQIVVYNNETNEFYTTYFLSQVQGQLSMRMLASETASFKITPEYKLSPITEIEVKDVVETVTPPTYGIIDIPLQINNCLLDNGFNPWKTAAEGDDRARHDNFNVVTLSANNLVKTSEGYKTIGDLSPRLFLTIEQNLGNLPITSNESIKQISDDSYKNSVYGTNISGTKIGYGAYYVQVNYTDGTAGKFNATNILKKKEKGDVIDLGISMEKNKIIKNIEIVVVYEFYCGAPGVLGIWWHEYSNWRCTAKLEF